MLPAGSSITNDFGPTPQQVAELAEGVMKEKAGRRRGKRVDTREFRDGGYGDYPGGPGVFANLGECVHYSKPLVCAGPSSEPAS